MTREEAIKILKFQAGYFCDLKGCEEQQAFTMAIKALEQEPCANIPFLLHKEFGCPLDECVKAYEKAIEYLRSKSRLKG